MEASLIPQRWRWPWRAYRCGRCHLAICPYDCHCECHFHSGLDVATCSQCQPHGGVNNPCLRKAGHHGKHRDMWSERWN